jgi:hypothetical protein
LLDLFYNGAVHASFGDKLSSMLMHLRQKSFSFSINKRYLAYHDSNGSVRAGGFSPTVFQLLNPSTCKPSFKLENGPCRIGSSGNFQHGFTPDSGAQQSFPVPELICASRAHGHIQGITINTVSGLFAARASLAFHSRVTQTVPADNR